MKSQVTEDVNEIASAYRRMRIRAGDPLLLGQCHFMKNKSQVDCPVCNVIDASGAKQEFPCVGCIKRRTAHEVQDVQQCPACWQAPSMPCPTR